MVYIIGRWVNRGCPVLVSMFGVLQVSLQRGGGGIGGGIFTVNVEPWSFQQA